jgi:hypothetical protein
MTPDETIFFNRNAGEEKDGAWYSNTHGLFPKVYAAGNYASWQGNSTGCGGNTYGAYKADQTKRLRDTYQKNYAYYNPLTDTWEREDYGDSDMPALPPAVTEDNSILKTLKRCDDLMESYSTMPIADLVNECYANPANVALIIACDKGGSQDEILKEVQSDPGAGTKAFLGILANAGIFDNVTV